MSNLGPIWEDNAHYSPKRADAKGITRDTGTNIVAISTTRQLGAVCPTDTSGGLIKNVMYVCNYDDGFNRVQFIPVFGEHTHTDADQDGGSLMDIYQANTSKVMAIDMFHMNLADWKQDLVGLGAVFVYEEGSTTGRLKMETGALASNCATGSLGGVKISFASKISWQAKIELNANNLLLTRCGVNVDRVDEAQDTARRQLGIEGCDGHGTNWVIINANGNSSSLTVTPTTSPLPSSGNVKNYKLIEMPATEVRLYENGVSVGASSTNVASASDSDGKRLVRLGIKATTGATRILYLNIMKLLGDPGSSDLS